MKISIIGSVGIPAKYGGFETLVEQLVLHNKSEDIQFSVYCSGKYYSEKRWVYHGAKTEYIPLKANGLQSILYDIVSLIKASRRSDSILILGVSGCIFLPFFRIFSKTKLLINIDGLEHKRDKWNKWIRKFLKFSEKLATKYGDHIIVDNKGIQDYVKKEYNINSHLIEYGGDHVLSSYLPNEEEKVLSQFNLEKQNYGLGICRIEPENNVHLILEAYAQSNSNLIFIGNWDHSDYSRSLKKKYENYPNIFLSPAIYDIKILNILRTNAKIYLHGHSAGGTNPSLVEAMFFKNPILAFDCIYNRESTENKGLYFKNINDIIKVINSFQDYSHIGNDLYEIAKEKYTWDIIYKKYENIFLK